MEKKSNLLNRKTMRKMQRQEKKHKKDFFYKKRSNAEYVELSASSNNQKNSKFNKNATKGKLIPKTRKVEDEEDLNDADMNIKGRKGLKSLEANNNYSDDDEIDSDIVSDKDSEDGDGDGVVDREDDGEDDIKEKEDKPSDEKDELDSEIKKLERKLGLKDGKRFERFKKSVAGENYDDDLFDFLDNISNIVKPGNNIVQKEKKVKELIDDENINTQMSIPISTTSLPQSRLFSNLKISEEDKLKFAFQKEITSLLNKISEANLIVMFPDFIQKIENFESSPNIPKNKKLMLIYETITKVSLKMTLDPEVINLPITSCICSYISVLHYKFGNSFMLYFLKSVWEKINPIFMDINPEAPGSKSLLKNFIFLMIHFYILQNSTSKIYFDIIRHFIEHFNSLFSEMLLILLSYIGIEIRKEDPESLKEIISNINKKYNIIKLDNSQNMGKLKYIVDMIDDIKNNKYMKFNLSEKFNFFKTFVNLNKKTYSEGEYDINSSKIADKVDVSWEILKNLDQSKIEDSILEGGDGNEKEVAGIKDSLLQDMDGGVIIDNQKLESKMRKFKMTTDLKKMIFAAIASCTDCNDAFERLMRLNLKRDQAREIIKIIVLLATEEKCYNPFYKLLLSKLLTADKDHKYTFHYTIWDHMKCMHSESYGFKKIHNLAKLTADLMAEEKIALPVFLNFEFEDANESTKAFVVTCLDKYFEKVKNPDKCKLLCAKLVKNDEHVEFAKRLFNMLINSFKKEMEIEKKTIEYIECYTAATKVLKRIL